MIAPDEQRIGTVQALLEERKIDALVCRLPENVLLLTGYWPVQGLSYVVFPREGEPAMVLPAMEGEQAANTSWVTERHEVPFSHVAKPPSPVTYLGSLCEVIQKRGLRKATLGYEGSIEPSAPPSWAGEPMIPSEAYFRALRDICRNATLVDATSAIYELRGVKTAREIEKLRVANEIASRGLEAFKKASQPGRSEADVTADVEYAVMRQAGYKGTSYARAFAQVLAGVDTSDGMGRLRQSSPRVIIREGDLVMIELAVVVDGYWSDTTRTIVAGKASHRQRELYELVREAQARGIAAAKEGATGDEADRPAREVIERAGYGDYFPHHTGHGIGFRYHEPIPAVLPGSSQVLKRGMVHSVEPAVYIPGFGGVRIEDDVLVTPTGGEPLSHTSFGFEG